MGTTGRYVRAVGVVLSAAGRSAIDNETATLGRVACECDMAHERLEEQADYAARKFAEFAQHVAAHYTGGTVPVQPATDLVATAATATAVLAHLQSLMALVLGPDSIKAMRAALDGAS